MDGVQEKVFKKDIDDEGFGQVVLDFKYYLLKTKEVVINGILRVGEIFTNRSHQKELCIGELGNETCITKAQLDSLLNQAGANNTPNTNFGNGNSSTTNTEDNSSSVSEDAVVETVTTENVITPEGATTETTSSTAENNSTNTEDKECFFVY